MSTVMVIDDEERVRDLLSRTMAAEGHSVVTSADGESALQQLESMQVDLLLLDLVMPRCNGLQVLTLLEGRDAAPPAIVLSAVEDVASRVQALERGAVDFVGKPFHTAELVARVRRHLSSVPQQRARHQRYVMAGGINLDLDRRRASTRTGTVTLTEREFELLAHLMRRRGEVCRRDELLHDVWGLPFDPGSNVVEVCVGRLRGKLSDIPLETVRGVGYCFYGA